jgi:hypothetical protein
VAEAEKEKSTKFKAKTAEMIKQELDEKIIALINMGMDVATISRRTGASVDYIRKLLSQIAKAP